MKQNRRSGVLAAGGISIDTYAIEVVPGILRRHRFVPKNAVWEAGVLEVFPADIVKRLGTVGGSHAVHLDDDKTKIVERGVPARWAERFGHVGTLRPRVDVFDDRILFVGIKIAWPADNAPDVRPAIAALRNEHFRRLPTVRLQF